MDILCYKEQSNLLKSLKYSPKYTYNDNKDLRIAYLQPTSPFRSGEHIKQALTIADNHKSKSCVSICKVKQHPSKIVSAYMDSIEPWADSKMAGLTSNRQSLPALYLPNGAIYVFPLYRFRETMTFPIMGSGFLEMDEYSSIDVDSEFDFSVAQALENK
jgi:CMP-N-acetylneuraminic acid synthetase